MLRSSVDDHLDQPDDTRVGGAIELRDAWVHAIDRYRVLHQIVGSDGKKVDLGGDVGGDHGGGGDFDHGTHRDILVELHSAGSEFRYTLSQQALGLFYLPEPGDEGKHEPDPARGAGAQNGAQLFLEEVLAVEREADASPAEEGIRFRFAQGFPGKLVAPGVQGSEDHFAGCGASCHPRVQRGLLLLIGAFLFLQQKKLGPEQAHPLRPRAVHQIQLILGLDVGREDDCVSVGGDRLQIAQLIEFGPPALVLFFQFAISGDRFRGRIGDQFALVSVEDTGIEGVQIEDSVAQAHHRGNTQGTGEDGGVGGDAALFGCESQYLVLVYGRGGGGAEIVGYKDVQVIRLVGSGFLVFRVKIAQDPLADILDVGSAVAQKGVGDAPHRLKLVLHHCVEAVFGILPSFLDGLGHAREHNRVLQDQHVGLEDTPFLVSGEGLHVFTETFKLPVGAAQGVFEPFGFAGHVGDGIDVGSRKSPGDYMDRAEHDPA